ncbi:hypothetical protein ABIB99_008277 [Bradyrhizobium sp. LA6.1]|uniref:hypothetical protein n=1 Tax=Bradyrhizobium sp. LA6.1 TaxID=3156378 RepID=UPI0033932978
MRGAIGADARNVNEPFDTGTECLSRYPSGCLDVNGMKGLLSVLELKANRIYYAVGAGKRIGD